MFYQREIDEMINNSHGEQMDIQYESEHRNPIQTDAITQLKMFGYNELIGA